MTVREDIVAGVSQSLPGFWRLESTEGTLTACRSLLLYSAREVQQNEETYRHLCVLPQLDFQAMIRYILDHLSIMSTAWSQRTLHQRAMSSTLRLLAPLDGRLKKAGLESPVWGNKSFE